MTEHDEVVDLMAALEASLVEARKARAAVSCDLCEDRGVLVTKDGETTPCIDCDV